MNAIAARRSIPAGAEGRTMTKSPLDTDSGTCHVGNGRSRSRDQECGAIPENGDNSSWGGARAGAGRPRKSIAERIASGLRWYCVQTHPRHEQEAFEELGFAGFEVHLPRERISRVRIRQGKRVAETVVRPFFPGYLFVRLDLAAGWRQAAHVRGVRRLFGASPERPLPVPEGIVEALIVRADAAGVIDGQPGALRLAAFQVGDRVRVLDGPFADLTGVCQMSTMARVHLLLDAMSGQHIPIDLPRELVAVA